MSAPDKRAWQQYWFCSKCKGWASASYRCDGTVCIPASDRRKPCPSVNEPHVHRLCSNCREEWTMNTNG